jgi:hypothetical protein
MRGMFGKSIEVNNWFTNGASKAVAATPSILRQGLFESRGGDRLTRRCGLVERCR